MSLDKVLKRSGMTVKSAAREAGIEPSHLSAYKSGSRTMGRKAAEKLAEVFEQTPDALMVSNRASVMNRAAKRGDRAGVLNACKGLMEVADEYATPGSDLEETLDQLTEYAVKFAGTATGTTI